jgi:hypothetical protein
MAKRDLAGAIAALQDGASVDVSDIVKNTIIKTLESAQKAEVAAKRYTAQMNIWARYGKAQLGTASEEEIDKEVARMNSKGVAKVDA